MLKFSGCSDPPGRTGFVYILNLDHVLSFCQCLGSLAKAPKWATPSRWPKGQLWCRSCRPTSFCTSLALHFNIIHIFINNKWIKEKNNSCWCLLPKQLSHIFNFMLTWKAIGAKPALQPCKWRVCSWGKLEPSSVSVRIECSEYQHWQSWSVVF